MFKLVHYIHVGLWVQKIRDNGETRTELVGTQTKDGSVSYWMLAGVIPYSLKPIRYAFMSNWTFIGSDPKGILVKPVAPSDSMSDAKGSV